MFRKVLAAHITGINVSGAFVTKKLYLGQKHKMLDAGLQGINPFALKKKLWKQQTAEPYSSQEPAQAQLNFIFQHHMGCKSL